MKSLLVSFLIFASAARAAGDDTLSSGGSRLYPALAYTSVYYAGSMLLLSNTWYKDKPAVPFHFYNDTGGWLQVDKMGHAFGSYVYSYIGYHFLRNYGLSQSDALLFGGTLGLVLQTPIEIMDGIHQGYGFSWGDMAANSFGSALVISQQLLFGEQTVKFKFSYSESPYSRNANGYLGTSSLNRVLKDYNGHTYWFSVPLNKVTGGSIFPEWLCASAGYGAGGMYGEFSNISSYNGVTIPDTRRYRQYLLSLDIDWTRIRTDSKLLNLLLQALTFIKLPFPAAEYNSTGKLKLHWIYY